MRENVLCLWKNTLESVRLYSRVLFFRRCLLLAFGCITYYIMFRDLNSLDRKEQVKPLWSMIWFEFRSASNRPKCSDSITLKSSMNMKRLIWTAFIVFITIYSDEKRKQKKNKWILLSQHRTNVRNVHI